MGANIPPVPEQFAGVLDWVPTYGIALRRVGTAFEVVRIDGEYGDAVAGRLFAAWSAAWSAAVPGRGPGAHLDGDGGPGPVVEDRSRRHAVYFFLAPGAGLPYRWPPGTTYLGRRSGEAYVGVPAVDGETWPLSWRCPPTRERPFVDPALLHASL
ncbi:hypothetical protein [Yinghuangia soli]|uniref:Uncharacterized protein n=1 Tax=Yinghuangia soli TaxID=2908204 RepID=A0AA41TZC5_9ACTN|nr:hypothetical protein [Yinghuangia soli]MCF2527356.1 hypothetical protein [Yinghuangia soli]